MKPVHRVTIGRLAVGGDAPLAFIAGPCVIESPAHTMEMALAISDTPTTSRGPGLASVLCIVALSQAEFLQHRRPPAAHPRPAVLE